MRKSQANTWTETPGRYIRFYDKQNEVRFTHSNTLDQKLAFYRYNSVTHFSGH